VIAIDGIDGCGKTTQARAMSELFSAMGFTVVSTSEPTDGPHGQRLRKALDLEPSTELNLTHKDREQLLSRLIRPSLRVGAIVVVDRYYLSTVADLAARGLDTKRTMLECEAYSPHPKVSVIIEVPVDVAIERTNRGNGQPHRNADDIAAIAQIYSELNRDYIHRVDGTQPAIKVTEDIMMAVLDGPLFEALCSRRGAPTCDPDNCNRRFFDRCEWIRLFVQPADRITAIADLIETVSIESMPTE
jgi:dTMP kinase